MVLIVIHIEENEIAVRGGSQTGRVHIWMVLRLLNRTRFAGDRSPRARTKDFNNKHSCARAKPPRAKKCIYYMSERVYRVLTSKSIASWFV